MLALAPAAAVLSGCCSVPAALPDSKTLCLTPAEAQAPRRRQQAAQKVEEGQERQEGKAQTQQEQGAAQQKGEAQPALPQPQPQPLARGLALSRLRRRRRRWCLVLRRPQPLFCVPLGRGQSMRLHCHAANLLCYDPALLCNAGNSLCCGAAGKGAQRPTGPCGPVGSSGGGGTSVDAASLSLFQPSSALAKHSYNRLIAVILH